MCSSIWLNYANRNPFLWYKTQLTANNIFCLLQVIAPRVIYTLQCFPMLTIQNVYVSEPSKAPIFMIHMISIACSEPFRALCSFSWELCPPQWTLYFRSLIIMVLQNTISQSSRGRHFLLSYFISCLPRDVFSS